MYMMNKLYLLRVSLQITEVVLLTLKRFHTCCSGEKQVRTAEDQGRKDLQAQSAGMEVQVYMKEW